MQRSTFCSAQCIINEESFISAASVEKSPKTYKHVLEG